MGTAEFHGTFIIFHIIKNWKITVFEHMLNSIYGILFMLFYLCCSIFNKASYILNDH